MSAAQLALVTGSTRGIGLAIASELARQGFTPILNFRRNPEQAADALQVVRAIDPQADAIQADVTDEEEVSALVAACEARGPIHVLVNNVGEFMFKTWYEVQGEEWDQLLSSNLRSTFLCCRTVVPHMRERRTGNIINILTMHTQRIRAVPNTLPYAIAKTGGAFLTKTVAKTEAVFGIRVNAIGPGFVASGEHTPPESVKRVPMGRLAEPSDIANTVAFLVSEDASHVTGQILDVHGGALL